MTQAITEEEFGELFGTFRETAFRLETHAAYAMTIERQGFERFLAGRPQPPAELPWWQAWLNDMAELTRQGKRIARVRFVDTPPTDYQRWEMWATRWHLEAGEDIRYLHRSRAHEVGIPTGDWWLFDDTQLVVMGFTSNGEIDDKTLVTDQATIQSYRTWRSLAIRHATTADHAAA